MFQFWQKVILMRYIFAHGLSGFILPVIQVRLSADRVSLL